MQGNLKQIHLPEVLQFISMGKTSGLLSVRDKFGLETTLMIRQGRIINSSALERQRRLGDLLVHRGILKRSTLAQVLTLQRTIDSDKRLGEILIERDIIQDHQIREVLRLQLEEEIWNLFGLEDGEFRFEQVDDHKLGEATVQIDIEPLLLEGTRRQDEWRKIVRLLPSDRIVLGISRPKSIDSGDDLERLKLSPQEWKVLAQVNGEFPIRALINRSGMGRFEVYTILAELLRRKLIYIKSEEAEAEEAQEGAANGTSSNATPRGVGGLLSRLTGARREERSDRMAFVSPIGVLATFVNRMTEQFMAVREYKPLPGDSRLVDGVWRDVLITFSKADLIQVEKNRVSAEKLETYLKLFEFKEATQDCYEDSVEALQALLNGVYRVFVGRLGERAAQKVVRELLDEMAPRITLNHHADFKLEDRVPVIINVAA